MRILVVDDDKITLELVRSTLVDAGYEVDVARDGREGLKVLRESKCTLVISDLMMPEMNGMELCEHIRSDEFSNYIYFILLTSCDGVKDIVKGLSAGADDFLTKPFVPAELCLRVRTGQRILAMETREATIFALAKLAESRDPETGAHLERMCNYARMLAGRMATYEAYKSTVTPEYVHLIYLTSPLHDIGKVGIPDAILLKPGRFCPEEFEAMKQHTLIGAKTLEAALEKAPEAMFLRMARDIALTHHERLDGSGYPHGLAGEDIPLCGRIVALADVYDALTTKRAYKEAFSHDKARGIILDGEGTHFDPGVVRAFRDTEEQFIATSERFAEPQPAAV